MRLLPRLLAALSAALAACATSVAWAQASTTITTQAVRVAITPGAFADIGEAEMRRRVGLLIADVNTIFAQQSRRRFTIDTAADITVIASQLAAPPCAIDTTDTSVQIVMLDTPGFGGTYSTGPHRTSLGGCIGMNAVTHLHDPFNLATDAERQDYLGIQLRGLVHEFEHTFGAGLGEYYELTYVPDTTGVQPRMDVNYLESPAGQPTDPYWSRHLEYSGDPLMTVQYANPRLGSPMTREAVIAATRFTRGTLVWVNTDWPGMKPSLDPFSPQLVARNAVNVRLVDRATGQPITTAGGASAQVYQFTQSFLGTASPFLVRFGAYDSATPFTFSWPGIFRGFTFGESRVLVKGYAPGYVPGAAWFTIFDLTDQVFLEGRSTVTIDVPMTPATAPLPTIALVSPANGSSVENAADTTLAFDLAASQGLRQWSVEMTDGTPVCNPQYIGVGVTATRASCLADLIGITGSSAGIVVKATDQAGRTSTQNYAFTLVDTRGPDVFLFPTWAPTVLASRQPTQSLVEYFDVSGVDRWQLMLGSQVLCAASVPLVGDVGEALCPWTAPRIADGTMSTVTLTFTAWDRLGHASSTSAPQRIDAQPPSLRVISPAQGATVTAGTDVTFVVDANDAGGMDSLSVVASGQTLCFTIDAPFYCTVTIPADWDGGKDFKVTAFDAAQNKTVVDVDLNVLKAPR